MSYPITVPEALDHLRLPTEDVTTPEWLEIERLIAAATEWTESYCKRAWMAGTKTKLFSAFPTAPRLIKSDRHFPLTGGVVSSVDSVTYYDTDYVQQTMSASAYRLVVVNEVSYLYPGMGVDWPTDACDEPKHIEVTYTVGSDNVANTPASVKAAILLFVGSLYEYREEGVIDNSGVALVSAPVAAERLLHPYKLRFC